MPESFWPLFDLRITTPRLELRPPREADIPALITAAQSGIHEPDYMPFGVAWTDAPSPEFERNFYQWYWRSGAGLSPDSWTIPLMVLAGGEPLGIQDVRGDQFLQLRVAGTASWLRRDAQGQGYGKEMRAAVLALAFDGLDAEIAVSGSNVDNHSSIAVSRAMGYSEDGFSRHAPRGEALEVIRWRLRRETYEKLRADGHYGRWEPVAFEGLAAVRRLIGLPA